MNFDELGPPDHDHPLLDHPIHNNNDNNQSLFRMKRTFIVVAGIISLIIIIALTMTAVLIYIRKAQRKSLPIHEFITHTKFSTRVTTIVSTTNSQIELSIVSKQQLWLTTTNTNMTTTSISTKTNDLKTSTSENCFSSNWNPVRETLIKSRNVVRLAVDNDFNIYTLDYTSDTLQKWLPGAEKPINLFEGRFPNNPIFYHSPSSLLYFFYVLKDNPGVYKLVNDSTISGNLINLNGKGSALNQLGTLCSGLYVTSAGDIFVSDYLNERVVKWAMNGTSGVLIASGNENRVASNKPWRPSSVFVDEINNAVYVGDGSKSRILRFTNESTTGVTVIGGGPHTLFSDLLTEYVEPTSMVVDKMGNILVGERSKITKWTPDFKSNIIIFQLDKDSRVFTGDMQITPAIMTFDKLENLYVYESGAIQAQVVKFIKNSTSCTNNLH